MESEKMPHDTETLSALYEKTMADLQEPTAWRSFLKTAAYNYARDFDDQVLIYAQNADATAVLTADAWNTRFHRQIQQGKKGILLFSSPTEPDETYTVFDIADTVAEKDSLEVPFFHFEQSKENQEAALQALNSRFGRENTRLLDAIFYAADVASESVTDTVLSKLFEHTTVAGAEHLSQNDFANKISALISNAVSHVCALRCEFPPYTSFAVSNFEDAALLDPYALSIVGRAISQTSADVLKIIIRSVTEESRKMYKSPNRTFDGINTPLYNEITDKTQSVERQVEQYGTDILRTTETELSPRVRLRALHGAESALPAAGSSSDDSAAGSGSLGVSDQAEPSGMGIVRTAQGGRPDTLDRTDGQPSGDHAATSASGADLQLKQNKPKKATGLKNTLPLFLSQEQVDSVFISAFSERKYRIFEQFQKKRNTERRRCFPEKGIRCQWSLFSGRVIVAL